jgi:hypothetical protein
MTGVRKLIVLQYSFRRDLLVTAKEDNTTSRIFCQALRSAFGSSAPSKPLAGV